MFGRRADRVQPFVGEVDVAEGHPPLVPGPDVLEGMGKMPLGGWTLRP